MSKATQKVIRGTKSRFFSTFAYMRDPYGSFDKWREKFGKTFLIRALNGDVYATANRENVKRIFAAKHDAVGQFAVETTRPLLGGQSVFLAEGEQHRLERALLLPNFHGELIKDTADTIEKVATSATDAWEPGDNVRIMDVALDISLEVILRVVFGLQTGEQIAKYKQTITKFVKSFHPVLAFTKLFQRPLFGLSPWNRFVAARAEFDQMIKQEMELRRKGKDAEQRTDLLSRLLTATYEDGSRISDDGIRDQLVTLLLAGHETTQIAMSWAMSWLYRNPDVLTQLTHELNSEELGSVVHHSKLLSGICNEALRLNPILPDVVRTLKKPLEFEEGTIPTGKTVAAATYLLHTDPEIYPEPMNFLPHRWFDRSYKPYEFMPFGGGIRRCIGAALAVLEIKIVVATFCRDLRFELPHDAPATEIVHRRNLTIAPKSGIPLVYLGRKKSSG